MQLTNGWVVIFSNYDLRVARQMDDVFQKFGSPVLLSLLLNNLCAAFGCFPGAVLDTGEVGGIIANELRLQGATVYPLKGGYIEMGSCQTGQLAANDQWPERIKWPPGWSQGWF